MAATVCTSCPLCDSFRNAVIIDEAHNVEDVCREAASLELTRVDLAEAVDSLTIVGGPLHLQLACRYKVVAIFVLSIIKPCTVGLPLALVTPPPPSDTVAATVGRLMSWADAAASYRGLQTPIDAREGANDSVRARYVHPIVATARDASSEAARAAVASLGGLKKSVGGVWSGGEALAVLAGAGISARTLPLLTQYLAEATNIRTEKQKLYRQMRGVSVPKEEAASPAALRTLGRIISVAGFMLAIKTDPRLLTSRIGTTGSGNTFSTGVAVEPTIAAVTPSVEDAQFIESPLQPSASATPARIFAEDYHLALQPPAGGGGGSAQWYRFCLWCMNPAVSFTSLADAARTVILASGTLSPLDSFATELGAQFKVQLEADHVIDVRRQVRSSVVWPAPHAWELLLCVP